MCALKLTMTMIAVKHVAPASKKVSIVPNSGSELLSEYRGSTDRMVDSSIAVRIHDQNKGV